MLIHSRRWAIAILVTACGLATSGCKERPRERSGGETIALSQLPAPVKATIDQQAQGRAVGEIEKRTTKGTTRYAVTSGSGDQRQELVLDETGKVMTSGDTEDGDD